MKCALPPMTEVEKIGGVLTDRLKGSDSIVRALVREEVTGDDLCDILVDIGPKSADRAPSIEDQVMVAVATRKADDIVVGMVELLGVGALERVARLSATGVPYVVTLGPGGALRVYQWQKSVDRPESPKPIRPNYEVQPESVAARLIKARMIQPLLTQGKEFFEKSDYREAKFALETAERRFPESPDVAFAIAALKHAAGRFEDVSGDRGAIWYYTRAIDLGIGDSTLATYFLGVAYQTVGIVERARNAFSKIVGVPPKDEVGQYAFDAAKRRLDSGVIEDSQKVSTSVNATLMETAHATLPPADQLRAKTLRVSSASKWHDTDNDGYPHPRLVRIATRDAVSSDAVANSSVRREYSRTGRPQPLVVPLDLINRIKHEVNFSPRQLALD